MNDGSAVETFRNEMILLLVSEFAALLTEATFAWCLFGEDKEGVRRLSLV